AKAQAVSFEPLTGIVYLALGRALGRQGELAEAEVQLGRALKLFEVDSMGLHRAYGLLVLASVRHGRGDRPGARGLAGQAVGAWPPRPGSWSTSRPILACSPGCWSRPRKRLVRGPAGPCSWPRR